MAPPRALSPRLLAHLLLLRPLLWIIFGVNIRGRENLDGLDQFILISNHNSHLDTLLLYAALPVGQILKTHPVAAADYFSEPRWLFRLVTFLFEPVWVDREGDPGQAIPDIQRLLDDGENIILFPEGTRGEPGELKSFRGGIGRIVEANRPIPVVAIFLEGPERALPRKAAFPVPLWNHVTIAPPQLPRGDCTNITHSLEKTLKELNDHAHEARLQRPIERRPCFTVAVLGIDGSGKSTLSRNLALGFSDTASTVLISDALEICEGGHPRELQPFVTERLRRWIASRAKRAGSLARYKIPKLTELLLRDHLVDQAYRWFKPESVFMDGMPVLNLVAWSILYRKDHFSEDTCGKLLSVLSGARDSVGRLDPIFERFPELTRLRQLRLDHMHLPDAVVFLDVPPAVCVKRIESRGERKQVHETTEKLTLLREAYGLVATVLERRWKLPVLILDGDRNPGQVTAEAREFLLRSKGEWSDE